MPTRRQFLTTTAGAGIAGCLGATSGMLRISPATAEDAQVTPDLVQLNADIEPIVRLIEDTPREKCFDMMVEQLRRGLPYRQFLAALFLAGIRNVNPQPPGFKFHCVFVIHAAHQLSLDAPVGDRLLPLFWALDNFKSAQQQDVKEGDFRLKPVTGRLPGAEGAWTEFHTAMDNWDEERADRAIVALVRNEGAHRIIEELWRYGARDYRNIGHKAIFVANAWRTLQTIGWRHAEPVLRSLVLGLLDFGRDERVNDYTFEDQSYTRNASRLAQLGTKIRADWLSHEGNDKATHDLLAVMRTGNLEEACDLASGQLMNEANARNVWDAVHLQAGELMMQQPGIYGIHTVTSANGLRYAFETSGNRETRILLLLQGIGWMCQFRNFMASKPQKLKDVDITKLTPARIDGNPKTAAEEILALVNSETPAAAAKAMSLAADPNDVDAFAESARGLIFRKATDAHDFKYSAAIFEDYRQVSPTYRPHMLATAAYYLKGSKAPDSPVMQRAADALRSL